MSPLSRRSTLLAGLTAAVVATACAAVARRWLDVVEVHGRSMEPTYRPGDRLIVERWSYRRRAPRPGEIVLAPDPREPRRELIKRVAAVNGQRVSLLGDGAASTDSRAFGAVARNAVRWRVALRYRALRPVSLGYRGAVGTPRS